MTAIHYVTEKEMVRRTGLAALGYSQPDKERILIQKGLPKKLENLVKKHEFEHAKKGEEGPFWPALFGWLGSPAGAAIVGGGLAGLGAASAGGAQARSQDAATAEQKRQYDLNVERQQPWLEAGQAGLGRLRGLMGLGGDTGSAMEALRNQPGYQFRMQQGQSALARRQGAGGKQLSGQALKEITRYGQEYASTEFGNEYNRLAGIAGTGQTAVSQMAGYGQNYAGQLGLQGQAQARGAYIGASGMNQALQGTLGNLAYQRRTDELGNLFNNPANYGQLGPSDWAIGDNDDDGWTSDIGW